MNPLDIRVMRQFIAVAEQLHFGRAAALLHMTQPPLSRGIRNLEERLGVTLLLRNRRGVMLTREGERLLDESRRLVPQVDHLAQELRGMGRGERGRLRIGFVSLADFGVLPGLLREFRQARPGVELSLREMLTPDQHTALDAGEIDFGFVLAPVPDRLGHVTVQREKLVVAVPAHSPLSRTRGRISIAALATEQFVMVPRQFAPRLHDMIHGLCGAAGFSPQVAQEAIQMQTVVSLVSSGLGVAVVPSSVENLRRRGVVFRPMADAHPDLDLCLAWHASLPGQAGLEFVKAAKRHATRHRAGRVSGHAVPH